MLKFDDNVDDDEYSVKSSSLGGGGGGLLERAAARTGVNAPPRLNTEIIRPTTHILNPNSQSSPYLTISPGISPTTLLESPVFLSNSLVQSSPTTGNFAFGANWNSRNSTLSTGVATDGNKSNFFDADDDDSSSFVFKPFAEANPSFFLGATSNIIPQDNTRPSQSAVHLQSDFSKPPLEKDGTGNTIMSEPPLLRDEPQDEELDQRVSGDSVAGGAPSEDGYNWRKYGQKQVKGSDFPRSYYKCTIPNCPVKKKVERSPEGHITEIIYQGAHNHAKPPPNRRLLAVGSPSMITDMQHDMPDPSQIEVTSAASNGTQFEPPDVVDGLSTFSNEEDEDDCGTHGNVPLGYDGEADDSETKKRKMENYATEISGATRAIREPRVVVQTTSEVDILDDGFRWRKYGQKVVKGNPNPRSYYKCTSAGCTVRKHVERASHDLKAVITTYEGKHNHDVPAARNSSNNSVNNAANSRTEASQIHNTMARFEKPPQLGSLGLPMGPGPPPAFSFQPSMGLGNFAMPELKLPPVLPVHHYMVGQQNENGNNGTSSSSMMLDPALNIPNGSSLYQQFISRYL